MSRQDSSRDAFCSQPRGRDRRDSRLEAELLRSQKRGSEHNNQGEKDITVLMLILTEYLGYKSKSNSCSFSYAKLSRVEIVDMELLIIHCFAF